MRSRDPGFVRIVDVLIRAIPVMNATQITPSPVQASFPDSLRIAMDIDKRGSQLQEVHSSLVTKQDEAS